MAFVHGVIGAGGERMGELADINLLTDVGWTTINFESRCLPFSVYPSGFLLFLASPARTCPATQGRQKFRGKCLHPRARGSRFSLIAFFCTLWQYEVTDCRLETQLVVGGVVTGRVGTGYTKRGRKSVGSRWRWKFFLVSSVRTGLGSRKKKRNGWECKRGEGRGFGQGSYVKLESR